MVRDMLTEIFSLLRQDDVLNKIKIKSFERPESLKKQDTSIVIIPITPPVQATFASDKPLQKKFIYQINVESIDRLECKKIHSIIEQIFWDIDFSQWDTGLERYDRDTNRYFETRTYKGYSQLNENY
ncbi:hypothetical protein MP619_04945 [Streptococcus dysgalactiae]|uniref:Phage protein n=1 Tax=Streptococcus dysgalactiae TaxID=1334 RepID=A0AAE9UNI1_STRDY|nr:hypothetical protein [Streptococcus dysgalactiae]QGH04847.1 hypothetical protein EA458_10565 [Streptococcus dysgalactiae subsp. dysgalactiae]WAI93946.1 hypothetical protein MP619_04945 [Streptococcus dysgalactiae]WCE86574.1 hypothetical protein PMN45_03045 [Streptococcus dysgalactiae]WCN26569.1 hypothetical protein PP188_03055 [Streptococcus dysgalactiae]